LISNDLAARENPANQKLVQDGRRFLLKFRQVIKAVPLQIYAHCAVFTPPTSTIRTNFQDCSSKSLPKIVGQDEEWDPLLLTLRKGWGSTALSPDETMLATCGISIWDTTTGNPINEMRYPDDLHEIDDNDSQAWDNKVTEIAFSADGETLISVREGGTIGLWEAATGRLLQLIECALEGRMGLTMFSENRQMLAMMPEIDDTRGLAFVNLTNGSILRKSTSQLDRCYAADLSPDGAILATLTPDNIVRLWDTSTGELSKELNEQATDAFPTRVRFSADGTLLAASWDKSIIVGDLATKNVLLRLDNPIGPTEDGLEPPVDLRFSPAGWFLAAAYRDFVCIWSLPDGILAKKLETPGRSLHVSPDGKLLTSVGDGGPILVWDTESGELVKIV
jgi:WD40 repeat protein